MTTNMADDSENMEQVEQQEANEAPVPAETEEAVDETVEPAPENDNVQVDEEIPTGDPTAPADSVETAPADSAETATGDPAETSTAAVDAGIPVEQATAVPDQVNQEDTAEENTEETQDPTKNQENTDNQITAGENEQVTAENTEETEKDAGETEQTEAGKDATEKITEVEEATEEAEEKVEEGQEAEQNQEKAEGEEAGESPQDREGAETAATAGVETAGEDNAEPAEDAEEKAPVGAEPAEDAGEKAPVDDEAAEPASDKATHEEQAENYNADKPMSPTIEVSEQLSRDGSPMERSQGKTERTESPPQPRSPDMYRRDMILEEQEEYEEEEQEEEEEEEEEPQFDRETLIEKYHEAIAARTQIKQKNYQLQHKLAEYFRRKKSDDARPEVDINVTDQEQRYLKYLENLEDLRHSDSIQRKNYKDQIEDLNDRTEDKKLAVEEEQARFTEFKKQIASNAVNSRSGKPIPPKDIEAYLLAEAKKDIEVINVRLENIKLKNKLKKKEMQLKLKEELAEGLHLIDFEQLKIENQTYNEKIEERNEELHKLRKKITSTVQVLTHVKEKLQFVQAENQVTTSKLREVEEEVAKKRDKLTRTKQARDKLRIDNQKLRQSCGLLGNEPLLRDYEERKDESELLRQKLEELKMLHAELTLTCNGVRKKIEKAKAIRA